MLQLLLTLFDNQRDDYAGDEGQGNRHDHAEVNGLTGGYTRLKDEEDREGCRLHVELDVWVHLLQNRLVHVLGEVWHRLLGGGIHEHVNLDVIVVSICLVDLV